MANDEEQKQETVSGSDNAAESGSSDSEVSEQETSGETPAEETTEDNETDDGEESSGDTETTESEETASSDVPTDTQAEAESTEKDSTEGEEVAQTGVAIATDPTEEVASDVVDTGVSSDVPDNHTALDYGQHMEVNVNGKQYAGHPLVVPTNIVDTIKTILFHAHGEHPSSEKAGKTVDVENE